MVIIPASVALNIRSQGFSKDPDHRQSDCAVRRKRCSGSDLEKITTPLLFWPVLYHIGGIGRRALGWINMTTKLSARPGRVLLAAIAVLALGLGTVQAKPSGGGSMGSRGSKTSSAPPSTTTAPSTAAPIQRSVTQSGQVGGMAAQAAQGQKRGLFGGFAGGLMGGLLGAGLIGMLFGSGLMGGMGGLMSVLGLILQVALIGGLIYLAVRFFRGRNAGSSPAMAGAGRTPSPAAGMDMTSPVQRTGAPAAGGVLAGMGLGAATAQPASAMAAAEPTDTVGIGPADYAAFEKLLADVNAAWDAEDEGGMRRYCTPEMAAYFGEDLSRIAAKGQHDRVKDVQLLEGDLSEAWSEGGVDYATVAMRFSFVGALFERKTGRVIEGDPVAPQQSTELWTFRRERGRAWVLSAIQQTA